MKKHASGILVAMLAFCLGSAVILLFAGDEIKVTLQKFGWINPRNIDSPFSEIRDYTVRIQPSGAVFSIP